MAYFGLLFATMECQVSVTDFAHNVFRCFIFYKFFLNF